MTITMKPDYPDYKIEIDDLPEGEFSSSWSAPSNIALVKYWGKKAGIQIPANPSVSITLDKARTEVLMKAQPRKQEDPWITLKFEGQEMPSFIPKITKFFEFVSEYIPNIQTYAFNLETSNTFPHSAGIASSASSMAAMASCLVQFEQWLNGEVYDRDKVKLRASFFARLGSGSACRSLYAGAASWGEGENDLIEASDLTATQVEVHEDLLGLHDSIIIVDAKEKKVSSRAGHGLMQDHPYAQARFTQALQNWNYAISWLKEGQWDYLGAVIEEEALALHAMMMTSRPGYLLMSAQTLQAIELVREYRYESGTPLYFTLDAGPNLHLLYPKSARTEAIGFIEEQLLPKLSGARLIDDEMGLGAQEN